MTETRALHRWKFYRVGGLDQVNLITADDLRSLRDLDQKLWVALSCPTKGLEIDSRTLQLLDLDKDNRVRAPEVLAAIEWCDQRLKNLVSIIPGRDGLALDEIDETRPEGKMLAAAARRVLAHFKKESTALLTAADVADVSNVFVETSFNGDGIIPPSAAADPETAQVITEALECEGGLTDRSGKPGIDQAKLDAFYADLGAFAAWSSEGETEIVRALGAATSAAFLAVKAVRAKVDDYFMRCQLVAFDARAGALINRAEADLLALAGKDLSTALDDIGALPIARVEAGRPLPLTSGANPAWAERLLTLHREAAAPALGADKASLTEAEWTFLKRRVAAFEAWDAAKKGAPVEKLGLARVRALLERKDKAVVEALLAQDKSFEPEALGLADAVRLVFYQRDLFTLLRNFVSFADFYEPRKGAIFQAGTLYLDSRSCDLCVRVDDPGAHSTLGSLSHMYIAYCECRRAGSDAMKIAACFTQGDSDYLMVGRNGIFYDRLGRDWDATIIKILDNPISIRQAFFAPYKKFVRFIEEQAQKFAASKEKEADAKLAAAASVAGGEVPKPPAPVDVGKMVGIIAALGVGAGALGALFGGLIAGFAGLQPWWAKIVALFGVVAVISGPSMAMAWLKLRQRTLGPVLDANGWAINGRVKVNIPLGVSLTERARLPEGASRTLEDPFEDKAAARRRRMVWLALSLVVTLLGAAKVLHVWPFAPWPFGG